MYKTVIRELLIYYIYIILYESNFSKFVVYKLVNWYKMVVYFSFQYYEHILTNIKLTLGKLI